MEEKYEAAQPPPWATHPGGREGYEASLAANPGEEPVTRDKPTGERAPGESKPAPGPERRGPPTPQREGHAPHTPPSPPRPGKEA
jgi:hypothetical protein